MAELLFSVDSLDYRRIDADSLFADLEKVEIPKDSVRTGSWTMPGGVQSGQKRLMLN